MNFIDFVRAQIFYAIDLLFEIKESDLANIEVSINIGKDENFGDLSTNACMILAKKLKSNPIKLAEQLRNFLLTDSRLELNIYLEKAEVANPGFLNLFLNKDAYAKMANDLYLQQENLFKLDQSAKKEKFLIEFVSANPTGPMHLGHGRNGILGDVLGNILKFVGNSVTKEFYINDAGKQINKLGNSFRIRCLQLLDVRVDIPEDGYAGQYLVDLAKKCVSEYGNSLVNKDEKFFSDYAKKRMLENIKTDSQDYGIIFDNWFSELTLHESGKVTHVIQELKNKDMVYEQDGALWFRSTLFGDEKDRVIKKADGELTYIAADIAYHENKFERGFDRMVDVLGQDHHGYVARLKATIKALGYDSSKLDVILYQLVSLKNQDEVVRMSKRKGNFTTLREVIDTVGTDVARFFYLNRKADSHLDFDLSIALKRTEENPVFYIQYAYVRINSILEKALMQPELKKIITDYNDNCLDKKELEEIFAIFQKPEIELLKKIFSLKDLLLLISKNYQTNMLANYAFEFAHDFHHYYSSNKILDLSDLRICKARLFTCLLVKKVFEINLDLLGLSKPEKM